MDHIPGEEMPAVAKAPHEVVQEAINAGVWVFGGGLENQKASIGASGRPSDRCTHSKVFWAGYWARPETMPRMRKVVCCGARGSGWPLAGSGMTTPGHER